MIIVLNNKCHFSKKEYIQYLKNLKKVKIKDEQIILCPPMAYLAITSSQKFKIGSQNVSKNSYGPYTGEVSAEQLKSLGITYCLVGHKERKNLHESINDIKDKIKLLLKQGITPIVCIGETFEDSETGLMEKRLTTELRKIVKDLSQKDKEKLMIAYEPMWTIGSNKIPSKDYLEKVLKTIRKILPNNKILYGGGITEENIIIIKKCNLGGYLIGNLSLSPEKINSFLQTIKY